VSAIYTAGVDILMATHCIATEDAGFALIMADHEGKLQEWWLAMTAKLCKLQMLYSPATITAMERNKVLQDTEAPPFPIQKVALYLPLELTKAEHTGVPMQAHRCRGTSAGLCCRMDKYISKQRRTLTL
jgi:hypothetical protein